MTDPGQSAEELSGEALELPPERRSAFLDQACRDTPELRSLVEHLLEKHQRGGDFLVDPAFTPDGNAALTAASTAVTPGRFQAGQLIADRFAIELTVAAAASHDCQLRYSQKFSIIQTLLSVVQPATAKCRRSGDGIPLVPMKLSF